MQLYWLYRIQNDAVVGGAAVEAPDDEAAALLAHAEELHEGESSIEVWNSCRLVGAKRRAAA
jgi:hypothetical protein